MYNLIKLFQIAHHLCQIASLVPNYASLDGENKESSIQYFLVYYIGIYIWLDMAFYTYV